MAAKGQKAKRRPKGEGTFVQRKDGRWCFVADLGKDASGKRRRLTIYGKTRAELVRKVQDAKAQSGGHLEVRETGSVADYLRTWLSNTIKPNRAATTAALYEGLLATHVLPRVERIRADRFGPDEVDALFAKMRAAGASASVMNSSFRILRAAFAARAKRTRLPNPLTAVEAPRYTPQEVRPLDVDQARAFLKAAKKSPLESLFVLALVAGLRLGEVLALKWGDVDEARGTVTIERALRDVKGSVTIETTKTKRSRRVVPLSRIATDALARRKAAADREGHGSEFIHVGPTGAFLRPSFVRRRHLAPILADAGIAHGTVHGLRHAFATLLALDGTPLRTIGDTMGHSRPSVTLDVYQHSDPTSQRAAIDRLDRTLSRRKSRGRPDLRG